MLATPIDVSISSNRKDTASGTRTVVFQERKKELMSMSADFADDDNIMTGIIQEGMKELLSTYFGPAVVIDVPPTEISAATLIPIFEKIGQTPESLPPRLLLKSACKPKGPLPKLTLDAVEYLYAYGIALLGVDWRTLEKPDDKVLYLMRKNKMVWLVNIDLSNVAANRMYFLSALPLRTNEDTETACRALLIPLL